MVFYSLICLHLFQALEKEFAPVEEKLSQLNKMAYEVAEAYPQNSSNVQSQLANISAMWKRLKEKQPIPIGSINWKRSACYRALSVIPEI